MEPENNIEMILRGYMASSQLYPLLVIGNVTNKFGKYLNTEFNHRSIQFVGSIYDQHVLNNLRYYSKIYFHGHSVGGTNPSLLEAMASQALIAAHNNSFNKGVLKDNAYYFSSPDEVAELIATIKKEDNLQLVKNNYTAIIQEFNWEKINGDYLQFFENCFTEKNRGAAG